MGLIVKQEWSKYERETVFYVLYNLIIDNLKFDNFHNTKFVFDKKCFLFDEKKKSRLSACCVKIKKCRPFTDQVSGNSFEALL